MNTPQATARLADRSISAAGWMMAGTGVRAVLQLTAQIVFARIIGPEQIGIFLLASLVIGLSALFADVGMSYALIQKQAVTSRDIRFAFTGHVLIAAVVSGVVALAAPLVAGWFDKPDVGPVLAVLSAVLLINAAGVPAMNLLRRDLEYKAIQKALLASYFAGYIVVGVPAVMLGAGVWAPVAALLVQASLNTVLLFAQKPHPVRPLLKGDDSGWFARYSATFLSTNLTNWALMNLDRAVLGRVASATSVGFYAAPYNLLTNPTVQILNTIQSVLFSTASRLQDRRDDMRRAYLALLGAIGVFVLPLFAAISISATPLVAVLYGPAWAPAADVVGALAWAMPLYLIWAIATPVLWNTGQKSREAAAQLPLLPLWAIAAWFSAHQGIGALAWSLVGMQAVRAAVTTFPAARALSVSLADSLRALRPGLVVGAAVAAAVGVVLAGAADAAPLARLAAAAAATLGVWATMLRLLGPLMPPELNNLVGRSLAKLPGPLPRLVAGAVFPNARS